MLDAERKLGEMKSRFVSMASHEFRTPLTAVLTSATLIGKYRESDQQRKRQKHIDRICSTVNNLNDILEEFMSVGKIEEGKINANPRLGHPVEARVRHRDRNAHIPRITDRGYCSVLTVIPNRLLKNQSI